MRERNLEGSQFIFDNYSEYFDDFPTEEILLTQSLSTITLSDQDRTESKTAANEALSDAEYDAIILKRKRISTPELVDLLLKSGQT
ncbi:MAG: hypothetical protein MHMPM18_000466 [Marteilia pararefringens]